MVEYQRRYRQDLDYLLNYPVALSRARIILEMKQSPALANPKPRATANGL